MCQDGIHTKEIILLYKHQWNTRWAFACKHDIFTREDNKISSQVKITRYLQKWKYQVVVTSLKIAIVTATYSLKKSSDVLLYDQNIIGPSSEIFGDLRKSSVIFGKCLENVRKRSSSLRNNFGNFSEIFEKWLEIFGKSSEMLLLVCLYNKQNITCPLVDMNFIFIREISSWTLEDKIHIHAQACNILYI